MEYDRCFSDMQKICVDRGLTFADDKAHYPFEVKVSAAEGDLSGQTSIDGMDRPDRGDGSLTLIIAEGCIALRMKGDFFLLDKDLNKIKSAAKKMANALFEEISKTRLQRKFDEK